MSCPVRLKLATSKPRTLIFEFLGGAHVLCMVSLRSRHWDSRVMETRILLGSTGIGEDSPVLTDYMEG